MFGRKNNFEPFEDEEPIDLVMIEVKKLLRNDFEVKSIIKDMVDERVKMAIQDHMDLVLVSNNSNESVDDWFVRRITSKRDELNNRIELLDRELLMQIGLSVARNIDTAEAQESITKQISDIQDKVDFLNKFNDMVM